MLAAHYSQIRLLHIGCAAFSVALFALRGLLRIGDVAIANHRALRILSYTVDTALLTAAILLTVILHQYPFVNAWLTSKVLLLLLYVSLGLIALKRARTSAGRAVAVLGALLTFGLMVGVAITHHPGGWLLLLRR